MKGQTVHGVIPLALLRSAVPRSRAPEDDWEMTLLPGQHSRFANLEYSSVDERIAFAVLSQYIKECAGFRDAGSHTHRASAKQQISAIAEMRAWMANDARCAKYNPGYAGFEFTFTTWCGILDVDEGYMKRCLAERLDKWQREAEARIPWSKRVKHIMEERRADSVHQ